MSYRHTYRYMDNQQSVQLQLHSNNFTLCSGQVPTVNMAYGGGRGPVMQLNQRNMTSSSVRSRSNPDERFRRCPLESLDEDHGKDKVDSRNTSCSPFTICRPGLIFPWMNPRTTDSNQSGEFRFCFWICSRLTTWTLYIASLFWGGERLAKISDLQALQSYKLKTLQHTITKQRCCEIVGLLFSCV